MSLKTILKSLLETVHTLWNGLKGQAKKDLPILIKLIENLKTYEDNGAIDALTAIIPGEADNKLNANIRKVFPGLLKELHLANDCFQGDDNAIVKCGILKLQQSTDNAKDVLLHGLAGKLIELCSSANLTWQDIVGGLAEYIFRTFFKKV